MTPPPELQRAIDGIRALLAGERVDLSAVRLDMQGVPELHRRVYDIARRIPPGSTLSYGDIAQQLGDRSLARAVGQAGARAQPLSRPWCRATGCWPRVASRAVSAHGGLRTKLRLLLIEGADPAGTPDLFSTDRD